MSARRVSSRHSTARYTQLALRMRRWGGHHCSAGSRQQTLAQRMGVRRVKYKFNPGKSTEAAARSISRLRHSLPGSLFSIYSRFCEVQQSLLLRHCKKYLAEHFTQKILLATRECHAEIFRRAYTACIGSTIFNTFNAACTTCGIHSFL